VRVRLGEDADLLVVADGAEGEADLLGDLADLQQFLHL
jgi:hypothetical protein